MKCSNKQFAVMFPIAVAVFVAAILPSMKKKETPLDRAYRVCKDCGMYEPGGIFFPVGSVYY